jgi:anaerobic selenocysteine-containing dehydrogenase
LGDGDLYDDPERTLPGRRDSRGAGWERCTWDEALDDLAGRIRAALTRNEPNKVMYHVGRPGEDGFTERVLAAWGVDGHNSHTNICSSGGRAGYAFWMGFDRPSPDYANAKVIFLISAHLESGHYFNPHAQRIIEGRRNGAAHRHDRASRIPPRRPITGCRHGRGASPPSSSRLPGS